MTVAGKRTGKGGAAVAEPPVDDETQTPNDGESGDDGENESKGRGTGIAERTLNIPGVPVKFTTVAAIVPANISFANWERTWAAVGGVRESSKWWQGDLLLVGESKYKEKYAQALDQSSAEYGTLRNIAYVAGKFTPERRRPELTWSHHQAAAGVPSEVADNILGQAEEADWSVAQVRMAVREWKEEQDNAKDATPAAPGTNGTAAVAPKPSKPIGLQPVENGEWECPNCPGVMFAEAMWHCLECGAHNPDVKDGVQVEECLFCPEVAAAATTTDDDSSEDEDGEDDGDESEPSGTVSGEIIPAAAQYSVEDFSDLLAYSDIRALPVKEVADYVKGMGSDGLGACMALHEYLGRVIEAVASKTPRQRKAPARPKYAGDKPTTDDATAPSDVVMTGPTETTSKPLSPAPKPAGKSRSKPKASAAPVAVAEPEEAGLDDAGDDLPFE
jgi:hypothetical protein